MKLSLSLLPTHLCAQVQISYRVILGNNCLTSGLHINHLLRIPPVRVVFNNNEIGYYLTPPPQIVLARRVGLLAVVLELTGKQAKRKAGGQFNAHHKYYESTR